MTRIIHSAPVDPTYVLTPESDRNIFSDKRTVSFTWALSEHPAQTKSYVADEDLQNVVELAITHHKGQSAGYAVSVTIWAAYDDGSKTMMPFSGDMVRLGVIPAARYSRKGLQAAAESAVAAFPLTIPVGAEKIQATWDRVIAGLVAAEEKEMSSV